MNDNGAMMQAQVHDRSNSARLPPHMRWPREVVVDHGDGTVSLFADCSIIEGTIRARRASDRFREGS